MPFLIGTRVVAMKKTNGGRKKVISLERNDVGKGGRGGGKKRREKIIYLALKKYK
jgi:hypothetical protein